LLSSLSFAAAAVAAAKMPKRVRALADAMADFHLARGLKLSRRPLERSCAVDGAWVVSQGSASARAAVGRSAGFGLSRDLMKAFASSETFFQYRSWNSTLPSVVSLRS